MEQTEQKTLKQEAQDFISHSVGNIADLPTVSIDLVTEDREGTSDSGAFKYKVIIVDEQEYRVPPIVLKSIKAILEDNPNLKTFKVKKTGTGLATVYTVIPLS